MHNIKNIIVLTTLSACGSAEMAAEQPAPAADPSQATPAAPSEAIEVHASELNFQPCPSKVPEGCEMAVLSGDPTKPGPFTLRMRVPGPTTVPPHSHPNRESVTVLSGTVHVGFGTEVDKTKDTAYSAGDFYINPANPPHYVWTEGFVELQFSGQGPRGFELHKH